MSLALSGCADDDPDDGSDGTDGTDGGDGTDGTDGGSDGGSDGGDGDDGAAPQNVSLEITADGTAPISFSYDTDTLSAPANATVTLTFYNEDANPVVGDHDWVLEGVSGAATAVIGSGEQEEIAFTAPAEPGEYTYFCSVGNHREQGMEGTFTVTAS